MLSADRKQITFTDGFKAGTFGLWTSRDLVWYSEKPIKRVRIIRRADGYYAQFLIDWDRVEPHEFQGEIVGIDLGLKEFYTDSNGETVENPRYLRKSESRLKKLNSRTSRRHVKGDAGARSSSPGKEAHPKGKKQSNRYHKVRKALAKQHLKVSRQRKDKATKDALALVKSKDLIVYEDLKIQNMVLAKWGAFSAQNHHLAKSISDASWYQFTQWLQYFAIVYGTIVIAVPPHNTTIDCSVCGAKVHKTLSTRTHQCSACKTVLDRDHNAARNILAKGLKLLAGYLNGTEGHSGTDPKRVNAQGQFDRWLTDRDVSLLASSGGTENQQLC